MFSYLGIKLMAFSRLQVVRTIVGKHAVHIVDLRLKYAEYLCLSEPLPAIKNNWIKKESTFGPKAP